MRNFLKNGNIWLVLAFTVILGGGMIDLTTHHWVSGLIVMLIGFYGMITLFLYYRRSFIIDLDADPFIPKGWTVEKHQKGGRFRWNPQEVQFYLSEQQKNGKSVSGYRLRIELESKTVFNANLLDYLLTHPCLIPKAWKRDEKGNTRFIYFWGTIYRDSHNLLCVRYLSWSGDRWHWDISWLINEWYIVRPAALCIC